MSVESSTLHVVRGVLVSFVCALFCSTLLNRINRIVDCLANFLPISQTIRSINIDYS